MANFLPTKSFLNYRCMSKYKPKFNYCGWSRKVPPATSLLQYTSSRSWPSRGTATPPPPCGGASWPGRRGRSQRPHLKAPESTPLPRQKLAARYWHSIDVMFCFVPSFGDSTHRMNAAGGLRVLMPLLDDKMLRTPGSDMIKNVN